MENFIKTVDRLPLKETDCCTERVEYIVTCYCNKMKFNKGSFYNDLAILTKAARMIQKVEDVSVKRDEDSEFVLKIINKHKVLNKRIGFHFVKLLKKKWQFEFEGYIYIVATP